MFVADLAQPSEEGGGRGEVAALALDRLDHDGGHIGGRHDPAQDRVPQHLELVGAVTAGLLAPAANAGEGRVLDHRQQRSEPGPLADLRVGQRQRPHGAAVEAALEGDDPRSPGVEAGQLDRALHGLGSRVGEEHAGRLAERRDARQLLAEFHVARLVEVSGRDVDQPLGLLLDRRHHRRVAVTGGDDRDARREVEEPIAVDVDDHVAGAGFGDQRVGPRQGGADGCVVSRDEGSGSRAGKLGDDVRRR